MAEYSSFVFNNDPSYGRRLKNQTAVERTKAAADWFGSKVLYAGVLAAGLSYEHPSVIAARRANEAHYEAWKAANP